MKNIVIVVLLAVGVVLGALTYRHVKQTAHSRTELEQVQAKLAQAESELKASQEAIDRAESVQRNAKALQATLSQTSKFAKEKELQAQQLEEKLASTKTNSSNPMAGMAKMFKDPAMRDMIKNSQKAVMGPLIDKQYGALMNQLNLTEEQGAEFKRMLTDKMLAGADLGMSLMDDSLDAAARKELTKKVEADQLAYDAQIKEMLGNNYPAYQDYEKSVPDRMVAGQFGDQLSGDLAMSEGQQAQLVQAMTEARTGYKWTTDFSDQKSMGGGDLATMLTEEKLNQFTLEKEQFDQQFLGKAQAILTPAQLKEFAAFQKSQRDMQLMGLKMAASMFGSQGH
jgi:uncharacterized membrane-anchored protein YhcB (DUF1043 family)